MFGTVPNGMLTLYTCVTEGCGMNVIKPMVDKNPWTFLYWFLFIFTAGFGLLNVVIGLLCENIVTASQDVQKELKLANHEAKLKQVSQICHLFEQMDTDNSGSLSRKEFLQAIQDSEEVAQCLEALELGDDSGLFDTLDFK